MTRYNHSTKSPGRNFAKKKKIPACASSKYLSGPAHAGISKKNQNCALDFWWNVFCEIFGKILIPCLECRVIASHRSKKDLESERHGIIDTEFIR